MRLKLLILVSLAILAVLELSRFATTPESPSSTPSKTPSTSEHEQNDKNSGKAYTLCGFGDILFLREPEDEPILLFRLPYDCICHLDPECHVQAMPSRQYAGGPLQKLITLITN
jgi:hypothetical protein